METRWKYFAAALVLAVQCDVASARAAQPLSEDGISWTTLAKAQADSPRKKPLLVYFGAEWCEPCKVLSTTVFNQADIKRALGNFDLAYVDGDAAGTPEIMERLKVVVFPTLLMLGPDDAELDRFVGSAEKSEVLKFLGLAAGDASPMALAMSLSPDSKLDPEEWSRLAQLNLAETGAAEYFGEAAIADRSRLREKLELARTLLDQANPAPAAAVAARVRLKSLVVDSVSEKPEAFLAAHRKNLDAILADAEIGAICLNDLLYGSEPAFAYLYPDDGEEKQAAARRFLVAFSAMHDRADVSDPAKLEILAAQLPMLPFAENVDAGKTRIAERTEAVLAAAETTEQRLAVTKMAARLLRKAGRELRAEAVIREALAQSPDSYHLTALLSDYARLRGDSEAAVAFSESAFRSSLQTTNGMGYGSGWVDALITADPKNVEEITRAASEIIDLAAKSGEAFQGFNRLTIESMSTQLGAWMSEGEKPAASAAPVISAKFEQLCKLLSEDDRQAKVCKETEMLLSGKKEIRSS